MREEALLARLSAVDHRAVLQSLCLGERPTEKKLRALRLLAPSFASLPETFLARLSSDPAWEIRAQAAWLLGLRGKPGSLSVLTRLLADQDPFVRRRAAEAFARMPASSAVPQLIEALDDPTRLVRYLAMNALAHLPQSVWLARAIARSSVQAPMRALVACRIRREGPPSNVLRDTVSRLLRTVSTERSVEDRLDFLRVLAIFRPDLGDLHDAIGAYVLTGFPDRHADVRTEQVRLLGEYGLSQAVGPLLGLLETEPDPVRRFHVAQALSRVSEGWTSSHEQRLLRWLLSTQTGWFAEYRDKGGSYPEFWRTILFDFVSRHDDMLLEHVHSVDLSSALAQAILQVLSDRPDGPERLIALYRAYATDAGIRRSFLLAFKAATSPRVSALLREQYPILGEREKRGLVLEALSRQPVEAANLPLILEGVEHGRGEAASACALALSRYRPELDERLARILLTPITRGSRLCHLPCVRSRTRDFEPRRGSRTPGAPVTGVRA